ncbi:MAG: GTP-binding protein [Colwellia sp.]
MSKKNRNSTILCIFLIIKVKEKRYNSENFKREKPLSSSKIHLSKAAFTLSAPDIRRLPADAGIEVAFAGRSNAGKSSALNTLTNQRGLARISKTPGRTQLINVFEVAENRRLIDLPGYGFAQVPLAMKKKWQKALGEYLEKRQCLKGLVILMDIRHPLKDLDMDLIQWAADSDLPVLALLTKCDKLSQGKRSSEVLAVKKTLESLNADIKVQAFSSLKYTGKEQADGVICQWLEQEAEEYLLADENASDDVDEFTE